MKTKDIEKTLWAAANKLRGSLDASSYKDVVLGLIFLKYISDKFNKKQGEIRSNKNFKEEDLDNPAFYGSAFFVPKEARWEYINENSKQVKIKEILDDAFAKIEQENPKLKGILPKTFTKTEVESQKLGELIDLLTNNFDTTNFDGDLIGRVYEYFLGEFARASGQKGGEFYTPKSIVKLLIELIEPTKGRVYDPACGSGGMFVQAEEYIKKHGGDSNDISVYGQELTATTWRLAKMNLAIRGVEPNLGERQADTFKNDQHKDLKAEFVIANPPFNLKDYGIEGLQDDPRWKEFGIPPKNNANYAWISHMISKLTQNGIAGIVLANGSLATSNKQEFEIRKNIIETGLVEGIISLPDKLFYTTGIPVSIWILRRNRVNKDTLFINADSFGELITKKQRELSSDDISLIKQTFNDFREGKLNEKLGFSKIATKEEMKENNYSLVPGMYVGYVDTEFENVDVSAELKLTSKAIIDLMKESEEIDKEILSSLKKIEKL